mmetsp:Transcript_25417/g.37604  ORF Transcript_25417/g.37604 Transcript_25417/m.37604 type:complete len:245 (-) Transcript_25417:63-797(-)
MGIGLRLVLRLFHLHLLRLYLRLRHFNGSHSSTCRCDSLLNGCSSRCLIFGFECNSDGKGFMFMICHGGSGGGMCFMGMCVYIDMIVSMMNIGVRIYMGVRVYMGISMGVYRNIHMIDIDMIRVIIDMNFILLGLDSFNFHIDACLFLTLHLHLLFFYRLLMLMLMLMLHMYLFVFLHYLYFHLVMMLLMMFVQFTQCTYFWVLNIHLLVMNSNVCYFTFNGSMSMVLNMSMILNIIILRQIRF